jgi:hypothetical protein
LIKAIGRPHPRGYPPLGRVLPMAFAQYIISSFANLAFLPN